MEKTDKNKIQLKDYLKDICGEDFEHPDKNRILSLNMVKTPYAALWVRLYRISLEVIFSTKIKDGLSDNQRYNMEERKRLEDPYSPNGEFSLLRAGDIETSGRNKNVKSFEKALYYMQKQLLLHIQNNDKEKIETMISKALAYIQKERPILSTQLSDYYVAKITEDFVDGNEYTLFCEDLAKYERRIFDESVREKNNLEKVFYSLLKVHEEYQDLNLKQIHDIVYNDNTIDSIEYTDSKIIKEEFYKVFLSKDTEKKINAFRNIVYTLLTGICTCTMKEKQKNEVLNEFISYFSDQPLTSSKAKIIQITMKSPVPVDVYLNEVVKDKLLCKINPAANPFATFEFPGSSQRSKLIFIAAGFSKIIEMRTSVTFDLEDYLTEEEIVSCYDRQKVLDFLNKPSSNVIANMYYLKQLPFIGKEEDLTAVVKYLTMVNNDGLLHITMQVIRCMIALSIKFDNTSYSTEIRKYVEVCPQDFALYTIISKEYDDYKQFLQREHKMVTCKLTIVSPINVKVYLNSKNNLLMTIDKNLVNEKNTCKIELSTAPNDNTLIFSAHNLEKISRIHGKEGEKISYNLNNQLSKKEIISTYDLEDVYAHKDNLTFFSLEQLAHIGTKDDIDLLKTAIDQIQSKNNDIRIPKMFECLCTMITRLNATEYISYVADLYKNNFSSRNNSIIEEAKDAFEEKMNLLLQL